MTSENSNSVSGGGVDSALVETVLAETDWACVGDRRNKNHALPFDRSKENDHQNSGIIPNVRKLFLNLIPFVDIIEGLRFVLLVRRVPTEISNLLSY